MKETRETKTKKEKDMERMDERVLVSLSTWKFKNEKYSISFHMNLAEGKHI